MTSDISIPGVAASAAESRIERETNVFGRFVEVATGQCALRVAIDDGRTQYTYAELLKRSSALGKDLSSAGVRPNERVGVLLGNSIEFLVAALGTWACGAVFVPLNPLLQEVETRKYAIGSALRAIVTSLRCALMAENLFTDGETSIEHMWMWDVRVDRWIYRGLKTPNSSASPSSFSLDVGIRPEWPATTMHSTGSTGFPKRVTRSHENLLNELFTVAGALNVTQNDRVLGVAPFFHNYGLMDSVVLSVLSGATLYPRDTFHPRDIAGLIQRERISMFWGVPFMFKLLADLQTGYDLSSLRVVSSSGVPLPNDIAKAFQRTYGLPLGQNYGSTETGFVSIQNDKSASEGRNSVGTCLPGVSVRILDDSGQPVGSGVEGRVEITSPFAARMYDNEVTGLGQSHFSAGSFLPGDIGSISSDGELSISARHRGFINVSGNKVDPKEVEAALLELPGIIEALVFAIPDGAAGEKVKAVVVSASELSHESVRAHCTRRLAAFKHPKVIEVRKELPRSPVGKILQKYLMEDAS